MPQKLIFRNRQAPGDVVMLTAVLRDLHAAYPGRFLTDVRTPCPALWEHNPHIVPISDNDPDARTIDCEYPLIHRSNTLPYHFIHGFFEDVSRKLDLMLSPRDFRGDIHLSGEERGWMSQVAEVTGEDTPFWIINAGGKFDFTAKWWDAARYQAVVNHFRGRMLFVQVGEEGHRHPALDGVMDLRGRTELRQLVRLVYHAGGVLCGVTALMHLAAAVPVRPGRRTNRPCVVVAGGREPPHWEAYPHHQFLHTVGALDCCQQGGCWRARVEALGDGDAKDQSLCVRPVPLRPSGAGVLSGDNPSHLPRCMDLITASDVIRAVELYLSGEPSAAAPVSESAPPRSRKVARKRLSTPLLTPTP